jgi:hypothetical protein
VPPRRNYNFEKRQKDEARKAKQEEKRAARQQRKKDRAEGGDPDYDPDLDGIVPGPQPPADGAEAAEGEEAGSADGGEQR